MKEIKTASGSHGARLLWTKNPDTLAERNPGARINKPQALFSAADPFKVSQWLFEHPWAKDLPLYLWHPEAAKGCAAMVGGAYTRFLPEGSETFTPLVGVGGPRLGVVDVARCRHMGQGPSPVDTVAASAAWIAAHYPAQHGPIWELFAEASGGGLLAIGAAKQHNGPAVAISEGTAGAFGPMVATRWGVPIRFVIELGRDKEPIRSVVPESLTETSEGLTETSEAPIEAAIASAVVSNGIAGVDPGVEVVGFAYVGAIAAAMNEPARPGDVRGARLARIIAASIVPSSVVREHLATGRAVRAELGIVDDGPGGHDGAPLIGDREDVGDDADTVGALVQGLERA